MIAAHHLGWMAGVIDTKGRVRRQDNAQRKTTQLILQVQTRHHTVIDRLCTLTGTRSKSYDAKPQTWERKGCTAHCPDKHIHIDQTLPPTSVWHVTGAGAAIVLYNLLPYFAEDSGLAKVLREVYEWIPASGRGRHAIDQSITRLASLGWQIPPELLKKTLEPAA